MAVGAATFERTGDRATGKKVIWQKHLMSLCWQGRRT